MNSHRVTWRVFVRRNQDQQWMEWGGAMDEGEALQWLTHVRAEYPNYEVELRKITMTEERVDA